MKTQQMTMVMAIRVQEYHEYNVVVSCLHGVN
jgi:hypothetical protein